MPYDNYIKNTIIATCISIKEVETPIKINGSEINSQFITKATNG